MFLTIEGILYDNITVHLMLNDSCRENYYNIKFF